MSTPTRTRTALRLVAAVLVALVFAFPFYWMVVASLSPAADLYAPGLLLWPRHLTFDNFTAPLAAYDVAGWFRNSLAVAVATTVVTVCVDLLAGYAFAKLRLPGGNAVFLMLMSTMMIPVQAVMVAQFELVVALGIYGTLWAVIIPACASAFGIFLARQFFLSIPDELIEAAQLDGAGHLRTFFSVVLPLCRPLVAVLSLLTFMYSWNDFTWPLIALFSDPGLFTAPLGLVTDIKGQYAANQGAVMAMSLLMCAPMVVLFVVFQRFFVEGLARTGLK